MAGLKAHLPWLIRKVKVIRGKVPFRLECAPAFNYCRDSHETEFVPDDSQEKGKVPKAIFKSKDLSMDLRYFEDASDACQTTPHIKLNIEDLSSRGLLGPAVSSDFELEEGQNITFILREYEEPSEEVKRGAQRANPTVERAKELGVDMEKLIRGVQYLRPDLDPIVNKQLLRDLQDVSANSFRTPHFSMSDC